jgi:Na+/proline symporter
MSENALTTIFFVFAVAMFSSVLIMRRKGEETREAFYVANRRVGLIPGAMSVAVSWVWAPALFVASSIAYDLGIAGALWFIVPNIACFFVFAPLAVRMRSLVPEGYSLPGFFQKKYPDARHLAIAFSVTASLFMLTAVVENLVAISKLYAFYTGSPGWIAIVVMSVITVGYSIISGLKASVITDVLQLAVVIVVGFVLIPWAIGNTNTGHDFTAAIFNGGKPDISWLAIAFAPGLSLLFGLIGGPLGDQMFFQRAMAVRQTDIKKTMYLAGIFFAIVPITLSLFGFLGTALDGRIDVVDSELVGAIIIKQYLPAGASALFFILMMSGLASTLDSAFCGAGVIGSRNIARRLGKRISEKGEIEVSRLVMIATAGVGVVLASISRDIWYVFMTDASIASGGIVPIVLSVFWKKQTAQASFWSLIIGVAAGIFVSISGHFYDAKILAALGAPIAVVLGLALSLILSLSSKQDGSART